LADNSSRILVQLLLAAILWSGPNLARAAEDADYKAGVQAYNEKDFASAAAKFQASISHGHKSAGALLYLGHAYWGAGDRARSIAAYSDLAKSYPRTSEATLAVQQIAKLDPISAKKFAASVAPVAQAPQGPGLLTTLTITEPKFGHEKVRPQTVAVIKKAISDIDPRYYKLLSERGATITISPNTLDRWPDGGGDTMYLPASKSTLLAEAGGQTYHRDNVGADINLFERKIIRGTKQLGEPFPDSSLRHIAFHEMGHAVDDAMKLSDNPTYIALHKQETAALSPEDHEKVSYFTVPMEACAEITAGYIGHDLADSETTEVLRCYPRTAAWLKQQLRF
jgi:hypothetical protein